MVLMVTPKLTLLILSLLASGCVVEQDPDWVDPDATSTTTEGSGPGDLWCSQAVDGLVSHNGQPVPEDPIIMEDGEWPVGCQCVSDSDHFALTVSDELDGMVDGTVILADDHPLMVLRDAIHTRTAINCNRRAYELAEILFCTNYCGMPYFYDWDDFSDFTSENCREIVLSETPLFHVGTVGDCDQSESNPLP